MKGEETVCKERKKQPRLSIPGYVLGR